MKTTSKISVIVPVHNHEKYIGRCLRSLINQTLDRKDYEIVVINDASTDKTQFALEMFKNEITILKNKKKMGLPKSLNIAIRNCKSTYVIRVDSDDYVNDNFLKILYSFLEANRDLDAAACDYYKIDDRENTLSQENCIKNPIACGILFRTDQLVNIGLYDEKFKLHEERDLRYRFLKKYKIYHVKLPLYRYRKHKKNITNNKNNFKSEFEKLKKKHRI